MKYGPLSFLFLSLFCFSVGSQACSLGDNTSGYAVSAVIGDWSGDGYANTEEFNFCSSLTRKEIRDAYKKGVEIIGFDLVGDVAVDYEDTHLDKELWEMLLTSGFEVELDGDFEDGGVTLYKTDYYRIWLYFIKTGSSRFKYVDLESSAIDIGGYGLLY